MHDAEEGKAYWFAMYGYGTRESDVSMGFPLSTLDAPGKATPTEMHDDPVYPAFWTDDGVPTTPLLSVAPAPVRQALPEFGPEYVNLTASEELDPHDGQTFTLAPVTEAKVLNAR